MLRSCLFYIVWISIVFEYFIHWSINFYFIFDLLTIVPMALIVTHKERLIVKRIYLICLYLIIFLFVNLVKYQYEYEMLYVHCNNKLSI